ncbi:MAG: helix-turn-helix domain protein [Rhodospirillales bacterium]|nr:helix-turn-helix domain protein [Rhodospirillales bacterium]
MPPKPKMPSSEQAHPKIIGEELRRRAAALGMRGAEVARRANLSERTYNNYVNGRRLPDVFVLREICGVLGTTINALLPDDPQDHRSAKRIAMACDTLDIDGLETFLDLIDEAKLRTYEFTRVRGRPSWHREEVAILYRRVVPEVVRLPAIVDFTTRVEESASIIAHIVAFEVHASVDPKKVVKYFTKLVKEVVPSLAKKVKIDQRNNLVTMSFSASLSISKSTENWPDFNLS